MIVPSLPFNVEIDLKENIYRKEAVHQLNEDQANLDYIKIQLIVKLSRVSILQSKLLEDVKQIDKDIERTTYLSDINEENKKIISKPLRNILITFAAFNQNINGYDTENSKNSLGYTQG